MARLNEPPVPVDSFELCTCRLSRPRLPPACNPPASLPANIPPHPPPLSPPVRRKFLRQNRDLARINSNQSLRIRGLENECARLLSENLDLRGQVLRLEKELEDDTSQRVADHALQIKQKMEAQLVELGSLLAGFGVEPPAKRQTPAAPRLADRPARLSLSSGTATPPKRKVPPVLSPTEAESLAAQEGRLPPIYENKTFPRQTLRCVANAGRRSCWNKMLTAP